MGKGEASNDTALKRRRPLGQVKEATSDRKDRDLFRVAEFEPPEAGAYVYEYKATSLVGGETVRLSHPVLLEVSEVVNGRQTFQYESQSEDSEAGEMKVFQYRKDGVYLKSLRESRVRGGWTEFAPTSPWLAWPFKVQAGHEWVNEAISQNGCLVTIREHAFVARPSEYRDVMGRRTRLARIDSSQQRIVESTANGHRSHCIPNTGTGLKMTYILPRNGLVVSETARLVRTFEGGSSMSINYSLKLTDLP